jgi:hypothetical protein
MATCASPSPRRMVWGAVRNPTRTSGGPSEDVAGVPPGLRPMPFLTACIIHAEGVVGRGPLLTPPADRSCTVVCCAGVFAFSVSACFCFRCCLALLLLLRCPLPCRCRCCCCLFRCPGLLCVVVVRLLCLTVSPRFTSRTRDRVWLKMRTQTAGRAEKRRSSCGCGGSVLLLALSPYHPIPPASKRLRGKIRSHEGKWKAALGVAH